MVSKNSIIENPLDKLYGAIKELGTSYIRNKFQIGFDDSEFSELDSIKLSLSLNHGYIMASVLEPAGNNEFNLGDQNKFWRQGGPSFLAGKYFKRDVSLDQKIRADIFSAIAAQGQTRQNVLLAIIKLADKQIDKAALVRSKDITGADIISDKEAQELASILNKSWVLLPDTQPVTDFGRDILKHEIISNNKLDHTKDISTTLAKIWDNKAKSLSMDIQTRINYSFYDGTDEKLGATLDDICVFDDLISGYNKLSGDIEQCERKVASLEFIEDKSAIYGREYLEKSLSEYYTDSSALIDKIMDHYQQNPDNIALVTQLLSENRSLLGEKQKGTFTTVFNKGRENFTLLSIVEIAIQEFDEISSGRKIEKLKNAYQSYIDLAKSEMSLANDYVKMDLSSFIQKDRDGNFIASAMVEIVAIGVVEKEMPKGFNHKIQKMLKNRTDIKNHPNVTFVAPNDTEKSSWNNAFKVAVVGIKLDEQRFFSQSKTVKNDNNIEIPLIKVGGISL